MHYVYPLTRNDTYQNRNAMAAEVDTLEDRFRLTPELLTTLLKDHTTSTKALQRNILWATSDYEYLGEGYQYADPILPHLLSDIHYRVVIPRVFKSRCTQSARSREMAEVFTPSWVCNAQNNLIDAAWFGRPNVFNTEYVDAQGHHRWQPTEGEILFPEGKTWKDYVRDTRLEITCGEAPYIASRYDPTTGELIPISQRIGLLDRKLRIVGEHTTTTADWLHWAQEAFMSIYAYEWQGDNLFIARQSMLFTFVEYFQQKFGNLPKARSINFIAYLISWNVWQMDGLKGVVPNSCGERRVMKQDLFDTIETIEPCRGCQTNDIKKHNGIYCKIKDWSARDPKTGRRGKPIRFIDLIK